MHAHVSFERHATKNVAALSCYKVSFRPTPSADTDAYV